MKLGRALEAILTIIADKEHTSLEEVRSNLKNRKAKDNAYKVIKKLERRGYITCTETMGEHIPIVEITGKGLKYVENNKSKINKIIRKFIPDNVSINIIKIG